MTSKDIEGLLKNIVRKVFNEYPDLEQEDLLSQAWLILTEKMSEYDKDKGALSTFIYLKVYGGLRDYVRGKVLHELNMNGHRVHTNEYYTASVQGPEDRVEAKLVVDNILEGESGVARDIILLMQKGYTQSESAVLLGTSRQAVSQAMVNLRKRYVW